VHFLFALFFEIYEQRFSYTLLGYGGVSIKSLVPLALIDKTYFSLGIGICAGIIIGYLIG
jgi:hypothetical protein